MECPRCRRPLEMVELRGGPYRGVAQEDGLARCRPCDVSFVDLRKLGGAIPKQAGYISIERSRKEISEGCPRCLKSFQRVYVEYEEYAVEYEECPSCALLALDDGEIGRLRAIVHAARDKDAAPALEASYNQTDGVFEAIEDFLVSLNP